MLAINCRKMNVELVRRLQPTKSSSSRAASSSSDRPQFATGPGIGINSLFVNEAFCVTGSDDGVLRLWPLDFSSIYLEAGPSVVVVEVVERSARPQTCHFFRAEHDAAVTGVEMTSDGLKILAATDNVRCPPVEQRAPL